MMGGQKNTGFVWTPTKRRGPIAAEFSTPGPAAISLNSTFGSNAPVKSRAPAFTISSRHDLKPNSASPGPGQYNIHGLSCKGKDEPAAPSMHIRPKDPKGFVTPAPGDYCPEKSKKVLDPSPRFSFGVKTENGAPSDIPAPNSYTLASLIGSGKRGGIHRAAPSFTISGRPLEPEDKMKIPGPGAYNEATVDIYKITKSPAFSMGQRTNIPSDHTMKPGPGAHSPEKCMPDNGPMWSLATRLKELGKLNVPGPGAYDTTDLDTFLDKQPAYSMRPKTDLPSDKGPKPAPNAYSPEKYLEDDGPKWSMGSKLEDPEKLNVPGPGTYEATDLNSFLEKQPIFSMRPRTELPNDKGPKPSPNAYNPDKYHPDDGPKWTMAKRTEPPHDKTPKPSPNAYSPDDAGMNLRNPEFSFGIKHSPYIGQLRDQ